MGKLESQINDGLLCVYKQKKTAQSLGDLFEGLEVPLWFAISPHRTVLLAAQSPLAMLLRMY